MFLIFLFVPDFFLICLNFFVNLVCSYFEYIQCKYFLLFIPSCSHPYSIFLPSFCVRTYMVPRFTKYESVVGLIRNCSCCFLPLAYSLSLIASFRVACLLIFVYVYNQRDQRGVSPADSLISPVQNLFSFTAHYFNLFVPIAQQSGHAVVPRRLSLNKCLCVQQIHPDVASSLPSMNAAPRRKFAQVGTRNQSTSTEEISSVDP